MAIDNKYPELPESEPESVELRLDALFSLLEVHRITIEALQREVSFLAAMLRLMTAGHAQPIEYGHLQVLASTYLENRFA